MTFRLAALICTLCLCENAAAQTAAPNLTRPQRDRLKTMVLAVDAAVSAPETDDAPFRTHLLRASDGSHYLAFSITEPASWPELSGTSLLYVRLETARTALSAERSLIREWLAGNQAAPPPPPGRGIALGDMPVMGPTGSLERRPPQTPEMANLNMLDLERRRARERESDKQRQRRAEVEGRSAITAETLPFEDFDLAPNGTRVIERALTAGPGDYFLFVATAETTNPAAPVRIVKKRLTLPPASTDLTIGGVILADGLKVRSAAYLPQQQAAHPYVIGVTEILPSADASFTDAENLSVVFQIINPAPSDAGKPNLDVTFEVVRLTDLKEQPAASLTPQTYSAASLPPEFDLRAGHPVFATVTAPLSTLKRGPYRLKILVNDKIAGRTATASADFTVTATAAALLREAPPLGVPFRRESVLEPSVLRDLLASLRPANPSPQLQRALDLANSGRFVDLMVEEPVEAGEDGVRAALRGLAQLAVGDASAAVQFQRAQLLGAPPATTRFLSGAARAMQSRDADAISAWQEALAAGAAKPLVQPHLLDAYVRRGDFVRAAALLGEMKGASAWSRNAVAVLIATQKENDAVALLDSRLSADPADTDAQWLLLQALFSQIVRDPKAPEKMRARFAGQARAYIDANGGNRALAEDWLKAISS